MKTKTKTKTKEELEARVDELGRTLNEVIARCHGLTKALRQIIEYHDRASVDCCAIARNALKKKGK